MKNCVLAPLTTRGIASASEFVLGLPGLGEFGLQDAVGPENDCPHLGFSVETLKDGSACGG